MKTNRSYPWNMVRINDEIVMQVSKSRNKITSDFNNIELLPLSCSELYVKVLFLFHY